MDVIPPPRHLTPGLCKAVEAEMIAACAQIARRHGLAAESLGVDSVDLRLGFAFGVRVSIPRADGSVVDPDRMMFEALADMFGLAPEDYGREFTTGRERFRLVGLDPNRPKYPISAARIPDGRRFKFPAENVALLLKASLKDATPSR